MEEERKVLIPESQGRDEMNLAEFPFSSISHRIQGDRNTIEITQVVHHDGQIIEQEWIVTGSEKFGLPLAVDEDLYVALMQVLKEQGFRSRRIHTTRYELVKIQKKTLSKREYDRIERSLDRLVGVTIKSKNAFWDNKAKACVTKTFHLFDSYDLYDERTPNTEKEKEGLPLSNIVISEFLFNSIRSNYIKNLDTEFYFSLETPLTKRLYRFLDKKRYSLSKFEISLDRLATRLPLQDSYPSQIKRRLQPSHDELIAKGFLESAEFQKMASQRGWKVSYVFKDKLSQALEEEEYHSSLVDRLMDYGVMSSAAISLVEKYPKRVAEKLEAFEWLRRNKSSLITSNPAGWLRKSIEEDWQPPANFVSKAEQEERERKAEQRRQRREQAEAERIAEINKDSEERKKQAEKSPYKPIWDQVLEQMAGKITRQSFLSWISPLFISRIDGNVVTIDCPSQFVADWVGDHYLELLEEVVSEVQGRDVKIELVYEEEKDGEEKYNNEEKT